MRFSLICVIALSALASTGCKKTPVPPAVDPGDPCNHIQTLANVMDCKMAPFLRNQSEGDEEAFRKVLTQLRELAPPDSSFNAGARPWFKIVDEMLASRHYAQGCQECHAQYMKPYRQAYEGSTIPWDAAPVAAAK